MTDEKPYVSPPPEAAGNYKYFLLGDTRPIRVEYDQRGSSICAESPDRFHGQQLRIDNELLNRLTSSHEVEEITRVQFVAMCKERLEQAAKKNFNEPPSRPGTIPSELVHKPTRS